MLNENGCGRPNRLRRIILILVNVFLQWATLIFHQVWRLNTFSRHHLNPHGKNGPTHYVLTCLYTRTFEFCFNFFIRWQLRILIEFRETCLGSVSLLLLIKSLWKLNGNITHPWLRFISVCTCFDDTSLYWFAHVKRWMSWIHVLNMNNLRCLINNWLQILVNLIKNSY